LIRNLLPAKPAKR